MWAAPRRTAAHTHHTLARPSPRSVAGTLHELDPVTRLYAFRHIYSTSSVKR